MGMQSFSLALSNARRQVQAIEGLIAALDACGGTYGHWRGTLEEDLKDAIRRLSDCERRMIDLIDKAEAFWDAAECKCCGGLPFCDHNIEMQAENKAGRAFTDALRKVSE